MFESSFWGETHKIFTNTRRPRNSKLDKTFLLMNIDSKKKESYSEKKCSHKPKI